MSTATVRPFEVTHRGVLAIAIPMTLAYLSTPLVGLVDTGVIGQLGDAALIGGIALGAVIFDIVFTTMNFLRSGTTGLTAQAHGAQDRTEVDASFFRALIVAVAIGLAVLALKDVILEVALSLIGGSEAVQAATRTYYGIRVLATPFALINYVILGWLIGLNRAGLALVLQTILNGVNIGLSLYLVLGLDYGVAGVGWASFAAEALTAAVGFFIAFGLIERMRMPHRGVILDRGALIRMIAVNRDIMIRSFALLFAFAFFTSQSAGHGDVVLAANQVLMTLFFVGSFFLDGMATAAEQLAGRSVGARYRPAFDRSLKLTVGWGFAIGFAASLVFWVAGPGDHRRDDHQRSGARDGAGLPALRGADAAGRHTGLPDGWRLHRRDMVGRYAEHDAPVAGALHRRLVAADPNPWRQRPVDRAAGVSRRAGHFAAVADARQGGDGFSGGQIARRPNNRTKVGLRGALPGATRTCAQ